MERGKRSGRVSATLVTLATAAAVVSGCASQAPVQSSDNLVKGKQLFVERCGACHTMARAGTKGTQGPNLDAAFRQSLRDGFGRSTVRGVVYEQIRYPNAEMPADLVKGDQVGDVAAYVATSAARPGEDTGLLASAIKPAGSGKPAVEENGVLQINADPGGQLAYVTDKATASPGEVTFRMENESSIDHDIALKQQGRELGKGQVVNQGGVSEFSADVQPGTYEYFCTVQGHEQAGMKGTLTVR